LNRHQSSPIEYSDSNNKNDFYTPNINKSVSVIDVTPDKGRSFLGERAALGDKTNKLNILRRNGSEKSEYEPTGKKMCLAENKGSENNCIRSLEKVIENKSKENTPPKGLGLSLGLSMNSENLISKFNL